ncbi:hypothetical protein BsWGS_15391 [Bradybaena similaris]
MGSLGLVVVLTAAAIASPVSESAELDKRIIDSLLPDITGGGLLGDVLGVLGNVLGSGAGLLGGALEGVGDLAIFLVRLEEDVFKLVLNTALGLTDGVIETALGILSSLTKGLAGKTTQPEIYAEFKRYDLKSLCPVCDALPNASHVASCKQYCKEKGWTAGK